MQIYEKFRRESQLQMRIRDDHQLEKNNRSAQEKNGYEKVQNFLPNTKR